MLERATACLKSGVRDSLICAQRIPQSKRVLHPSFWSHGAGDLDAQPAAVLGLDFGPDTILKNTVHPDTTIEPSGPSRSSRALPDGAFLDFLYPPQALAWFHRVGGVGVRRGERSETRGTRRVPDGFLHASRRYASKAHSRNKTKPSPAREARSDEDFLFEDGADPGGEAELETGTSHGLLSDGRFQDENVDLHSGTHSDKASSVPSRSASEQLAQAANANDTPVRLAEADNYHSQSEPVVSRHELLRLLASSSRSRGADQRAWQLYNNLTEEERRDVRLKAELLGWFAKSGSNIANAHCISLYWSIPIKDRSLAIYEAVLPSFLKRKDFDLAAALQLEALKNIANCHPVSVALFSYAVKREMWDFALETMDRHVSASAESDKVRNEAVFWFNVSNIPNLVRRAANLTRWVSRRRQQGEDITEFQRLSVGLANEALVQYLQHYYPQLPEEANVKDVQLLFRYIHAYGQKDAQFFEDALLQMLEHPTTTFRHLSTRQLISSVYLIYRKFGNGAPTEQILMALLTKLSSYSATVENIPSLGSSITLDEIIRDWKAFHGRLSIEAIRQLLSYFAVTGNVSKIQELQEYLSSNYPQSTAHSHALAATIYAYARRANLSAAKRAFEDAVEYYGKDGQQPDIKCWTNLLYAHSRVDDLGGALSTFQRLLRAGNPQPDAVAFQSILQMLASRGDVGGVEQVRGLYRDLLDVDEPLSFTSSMMHALINNGQVEMARAKLTETVAEVRGNQAGGDLTPLFNAMITAYALRRELPAVVQTYRWMKKERVPINRLTYSALLQVLVLRRQASRARHILQVVMPRNHIRPTAFHYAIVMVGLYRERQYREALQIHKLMKSANIKGSSNSRIIYLLARAKHDKHQTLHQSSADKEKVLAELQKALEEVLLEHSTGDVGPKEPALGYLTGDNGQLLSLYVSAIVAIYDSRQSLDVLKALRSKYMAQEPANSSESNASTARLLSAFMSSYLNEQDYDAVEACWYTAKDLIDVNASLVSLPDLQSSRSEDMAEPLPALTVDSTDISATRNGSENETDLPDNGIPAARTTLRTGRGPRSIKLAPARRHVLSAPLRIYLRSLARQSRYVCAVNVVSGVLAQGYVLDNSTWNSFIKMLCTASPPFALSAFTLTEKYLIPQFPGWKKPRHTISKRPATPGFEHIRAEHLRPDQVMPQYRTMVRLAAALLQLRRREAVVGQAEEQDKAKDHSQFIGDVRTIRRLAPKTVFAVQSMPKIDDAQQNKLLHSVV